MVLKYLAQGLRASKQRLWFRVWSWGLCINHFTRWACHGDCTWILVCLVAPVSLPSSVFMAHWQKQSGAVAPWVTILQLPPWHCHPLLLSLAKSSSQECHSHLPWSKISPEKELTGGLL
jgi:hypothetical protein